ncbi:unnamed protein product [Rotaria socialis]|uniref:Uncharacterized protein n=2 Tax=Rotaria socialis TaxID=392032 RepID=A0A818GFJ9_9BILA|nr:unnamed protein product [Rotaria socialis]CAF3295675.1 unnamed protein product [Rotaria socialis]CAF3491124.1 unnamed protein product [Rotaria socialis]CAF3522984.1 unnamed protein product [Rotaria socialis]
MVKSFCLCTYHIELLDPELSRIKYINNRTNKLYLAMKKLSSLFTFVVLLMILIFRIAHTGATASTDDKSSIVESSASDENDASLRNKKETGISTAQQMIPSPLRRHHLKFGVLGKRYSYGYLGKRDDESNVDDDFQEWLNNRGRRRVGRPQYGLLG